MKVYFYMNYSVIKASVEYSIENRKAILVHKNRYFMYTFAKKKLERNNKSTIIQHSV